MEELVLQMVYEKINGSSISAGVYSRVPAQPEGQPDSDFPYIVIGLDGTRSWDTDDQLGYVFDLYFHVWSRYEGALEVRQIHDQLYSLFHRGSLSKTGLRVVDCLMAFSQVYEDPDGKTMHGISRYRLTVEEE